MSIELDIPDIKVLVRTDPNYNVVIQNPRSSVYRSGSYMSVAETAEFAVSASHANNNILTASAAGNIITFTKGNATTFSVELSTGSVDSASFATTASYAQTINRQITGSVVISDDLTVQGIISAEKLLVSSSVIYESGSTKFGDSAEDTHQFTGSLTVQGPISASSFTGSISLATVTQSHNFQIPFISESKLAVDQDDKLTFNPFTHQLKISGGTGATAGNVRIDTTGIAISSGSTHSSGLNKDGVFTSMDGRQIGLVGWPSQVTSRPGFATHDNPAIFVTSGSTDYTAYIPMEFQGSGSYTDGRVTVNTPLVAKQGIQATGSVEAPDGFTGSLYGTASVADGIDVVIAGIYETGSASVIIPAPSGGYTYISTASYALTASYITNNTWGNLLNIPTGLLSSSVQVYPLPVESSSYALTASYAMNGGGGGGAGSSGTSGTSGANGASGTSGTSGIAGSSGSSGTAGSSGTSGQNGTSGSSGTSGVSPSLPTGTVSSSAQIVAALPTGTVSSSLQISTGSFTGSFTGSLTGTITSASYAVTASYAQNATATVPAGTVSSSTQITNLGFVTSSATASFAITGSNVFNGNQTITGSLLTNADTITFSGSIYSTGSNIHTGTQVISGSLTVTGSGTLINIGPGVFSGSVNVTEGVTGSLLGTSSWANQSVTASIATTASYSAPSGLPSGVVSSSAQIASFGNIRLAVGTNRSNASAFYFNSNTRTASDSSSPGQDTAFLINSTGLSTVRVFLRQDNAGPNATIVGVAKSANGSAFSTATLLTSSSLSLTQDTIQTYTFSGLTLNQFDAVHIYCDPTNTPGSMFAVVVIS